MISKQLANLQQTHDNISGRLQANREALAGELKSQAIVKARIEEQLSHSGFASAIEVRNILSRQQDMENDKKKLPTSGSHLAVATRQLATLKSDIGEKHYDEEIHRHLVNRINAAADEITAKISIWANWKVN